MSIGSTLRIAWRNLGRNRRRTALALSAIAVAELVLVTYEGIMAGYADYLVQTVSGPVLGHVQVHLPKWREDRALDRYIPQSSARAEAVRRVPGVRRVSERVYGPTLVAKGEEGQGAVIVGIDVEAERTGGLLEGARFARPPGPDEVLVGALLAQRIGAREGDELAIVGQAVDGSIASGLYRVVGIADTQVDLVNRLGLVMQLEGARQLLAMPDGAHELVVMGGDPQTAAALEANLATLPELKDLEVLGWRKLAPEMATILDVVWMFEYFLMLLVFLACAAGAANTMMMATFERTRELGMLLGLGARPRRIVSLVVTEAVFLGCLGLLAGALGGVALVQYTHGHGIDLSKIAGGAPQSIAFGGMKWSLIVYPRLLLGGLWRSLIAVLVTSLLAALWPAVRAARLQPVEAMRA